MEKTKARTLEEIFKENPEGLYEGETMKIKGHEVVVPALSLGWIEDNAKLLEGISSMDEKKPLKPTDVANIRKVAQAALVRNYPNVTVMDLKELLDLRNFRPLFALIMGASGFTEVQKGTEGTAGE
jgi:hypothetical protein